MNSSYIPWFSSSVYYIRVQGCGSGDFAPDPDPKHLVEFLKALKKERELMLAPSKRGLTTTPPTSLPSPPPFQPVAHSGG